MRASRRSAIATLLLLIMTFVIQGPAFAVHDLDRFELDGDALDAAAAGDDWNALFPTDTSSGELAKVFVADGIDPPADTTYFTGGGSKDHLDIPNWRYTGLDQAPDKDEIANAYAAAYLEADGDLLIYFGADRFANNGDSQIGFWFFQSAVGLNPDGTFSGTHAVGDILVLSDFTNGGRLSTIKVYEWVGSGGSDGTLDLMASGLDCLDTAGAHMVCATVNGADTPAPWPFTPKFGTSGTFPAGSFYEGGVNLTDVLGFTPCFSSFLAETRSSQSVSSQLKDFALGGFDLCAKKSGTKFDDLNANGRRDGGEPGLAGWEIHVFDTATGGGAVHLHTTTDSSGNYLFDNLQPGAYTVCETQQAGWTQSFPASGVDCSGHGGGVGYSINLTYAQDDGGNDFGNYRNAAKTGTKFRDTNANGARDPGEPGLAGWEIHLFGTDGAGNQVHLHETTDASGVYTFGNLRPGTYTVCETIQPGWTQSFPNGGANCSSHGGGLGYDVTLVSGQVDSGNDFGNFQMATKTGTKFNDLDADGARDPGEPGLEGWEIHLFGTSGSGQPIHQHAMTNASGAYSFDVPPGAYTVCETQQPGWTQASPSPGADCSGHGGGAGYAITLASGELDSGNDFGNFENATKTGIKFEDLDADGVKDPGEPGLEGWQIHLFGTSGSGAAVHEHATTGPGGAYSFSVPPGTYTVCETVQPGWAQSFPTSGADCSSHGGGWGYSVVFSSGQVDSGNDFGNYRPATKTGTKFDDLNGNSARDPGEPGLSGWQIHLFGSSGSGAPVHSHAATDASGNYAFSVPPGTYTVCEQEQGGWAQSFPTSGADCSAHGGGIGYSITLTSGQADSGNDFGNFAPATKTGMKFEDLDADGVEDPGEPGLSGWEIHLFGTDGLGRQVHLHATTNGSGTYTFDDLRPGSYTVCETIKGGWTQSFPTSGADCSGHGGGLGYAITLSSGTVDSGNDFGNYRLATKTGVKFNDLDADGAKDPGEPGLSNWEIHLVGTDGAGNPVHQHAMTNASGAYSFDVAPGAYTVCETIQPTWIQSFPLSGADCSGHGGGVGYRIVLTSGQLDSGNDFGNYLAATKTGMKFEDLDADGVKDPGEPGLAGWEIHLFGTDGAGNQVHEHRTTDAGGVYSFTVAPGAYTVCETQQAGWTQSFPVAGADCSGHGGGVGYAITLVSGQLEAGNDFGNYRNATKTGMKFEDVDADGARDPGEPGLEGWEIHLFGTSGSGGAVHQHATTDAAGSYSFSVPPGSYTVCETQQAGWIQSFPASGASCATHGGGVGYAVTFTSGDVDPGNDFANFRPATKTGMKFEDLDADGVKDPGEPGLAGWEIHLFGTDGTGTVVHLHQTTDAAGTYSFGNLRPGSYTVCETIQAGWTQSFPGSGASCSGHGGGVGYGITLTSGLVDSGNDFGNFRSATKTGMKFEDLDADGVKDLGEPGLAGWEIHLFGTDGAGNPVHQHTTTGAGGAYSFDVPPGSYTVCETQQAGWTQSFPATGADCSGHGGGTGYSISPASGGLDSGNDFGNFRNGTKAGAKFEDVNGNGAGDAGEPGLSGWEIHLFGTSGSGAAVHEHAVTGADGTYTFSVAPGSYTVCETQQAGWTQSFPTSGADCSAHGGGVGYSITLASGQVDSGNDFGNFRSGTKTGAKFEDLDADGVRDAGEPGLTGWEIHLFGTTGSGAAIHQHVTTGTDGAYTFSVPPGSYTVCEAIQPGWTQSFPKTGASCSGHGGGLGYEIVLASGQVDSGNDFGNFRGATKAGVKWSDLNSNGVRDEGEPGIEGWEIHLFGMAATGETFHLHAVTDQSGAYGFAVPPGVYTVCETQQQGWTQTFPSSGADCSAHTHGGTITPAPFGYAITLTSAELEANNDFGNFLVPVVLAERVEVQELPRTGIDASRLGLFGLGLVMVGAALLAAQRMHEPQAETMPSGSIVPASRRRRLGLPIRDPRARRRR